MASAVAAEEGRVLQTAEALVRRDAEEYLFMKGAHQATPAARWWRRIHLAAFVGCDEDKGFLGL
ncbi:hypothetical protein E2562_026775 [Oryza meyeriana var. granulata]|uniref:Uncharacterized protein n=1 Tax=Oryza meyeriana var. granulata TaxID=110450 RepID=A0A6G1C8W9_9ORYZ|nr:hypothetical protein E2562_026775 [Oryza meyeriana var. granulata]